MSLATATASPLLKLPQIQSLKLSSSTGSFFNGTISLSHLTKPSSLSVGRSTKPGFLEIRAMKSLQGRVVCATNDKTVAVEVVRLAPHPKYKRRVRKKKKYQAHDPDNQFEVGDFVQLEKSRPISKTKTFVAVPVPAKNQRKKKEVEDEDSGAGNGELGLPLESDQA